MRYLNDMINTNYITHINNHTIKSILYSNTIFSIDDNVLCINTKDFYLNYQNILYRLSDIELSVGRNNSFSLNSRLDLQLIQLFENELNLYYNHIIMNLDNLVSYIVSVKNKIMRYSISLMNIYILRNNKSYHYMIDKKDNTYKVTLLINGIITNNILYIIFKDSTIYMNVMSYKKSLKKPKYIHKKAIKYKKYNKHYNISLEELLTNKSYIN